MTKVIYLLVFFFTLVQGKSFSEEESQNGLSHLNAYLQRMGSNEYNNTCENNVFLPPTFNIDIDSLVRWAIETQTPQGPYTPPRNNRGEGYGTGPTDPPRSGSSEYFYNNTNLELLEFNGKSYFFNQNQKMSWMDAMNFCRAFDMDLVSVESSAENDFIVEKLSQMGLTKQYTWTSGNKIGRTTYLWINGKKITYSNWNPGEPNLPKIEHCIMYFHLKWYDFPCRNQEVYSICEER